MHPPTPRWGGGISSTAQCAWSFFQACNPMLPLPASWNVSGCTTAVHHICQIIWENKHDYEPPGCSMYCMEHHSHYNLLRTQRRMNHPLSTISQIARNVAAVAASTLLSPEPQLFEVNNNAVLSSPAKSMLTPGGKSCNVPPRVNR